MPEKVGAVVEIVEDGESQGVLINGTDVGWIAVDSLRVEAGAGGDRKTPTTVTLTLLPSRVIIRSGE